jgi:hypothetical protein
MSRPWSGGRCQLKLVAPCDHRPALLPADWRCAAAGVNSAYLRGSTTVKTAEVRKAQGWQRTWQSLADSPPAPAAKHWYPPPPPPCSRCVLRRPVTQLVLALAPFAFVVRPIFNPLCALHSPSARPVRSAAGVGRQAGRSRSRGSGPHM